MLQWRVNKHKTNWHLKLFPTLWAYRNSVKTTIRFTPFRLVFGELAALPIECEIPSLHLIVELLPDTQPLEQTLIMLEHASEDRFVALQTIEAAKKCTKAQYDQKVHPHTFQKVDLVLIYDQVHDVLGHGKFESLWLGPYIIHKDLGKGAYVLEDFEGHLLPNPCNALYLKKFYP